MNHEDNAASEEVPVDGLLSAIQSFLIESAAPHLEGRNRFNAKVAANALGIVQRELSMGPALRALDENAATQWLSTLETDATIAQQLSRALAKREIQDDPAFFNYLKTRQLLVTAINNPKYASRSIAEARWSSTVC